MDMVQQVETRGSMDKSRGREPLPKSLNPLLNLSYHLADGGQGTVVYRQLLKNSNPFRISSAERAWTKRSKRRKINPVSS